jgi:hypothetical protein
MSYKQTPDDMTIQIIKIGTLNVAGTYVPTNIRAADIATMPHNIDRA